MQENTESGKPENEDTPEKEESVGEETSSSESSDSTGDESAFEEHEGEVLPPERKKRGGCGFFLFILLLLGGGSGYLYYTDQIPPEVMQWIEPLIELQQNVQVTPPPVTRPPQKKPIAIEEKPISKEAPVIEEKIAEEITPIVEEAEHISGSQTEPATAPEDTRFSAKISGNTTFVEPDAETVLEIPEEPVEELFVEPTPVMSATPTPPQQPAPPKEEERNEAVQAYLDSFESVLVKIVELIKTGFSRAKDYLMQFFS